MRAPLIATVFLALHDILEKALCPTRFLKDTHRGEVDARQIIQEKDAEHWFPLAQGDAVVMDSRLLHRGGANTSSGASQTILAITFIECAKSQSIGKPSTGGLGAGATGAKRAPESAATRVNLTTTGNHASQPPPFHVKSC